MKAETNKKCFFSTLRCEKTKNSFQTHPRLIDFPVIGYSIFGGRSKTFLIFTNILKFRRIFSWLDENEVGKHKKKNIIFFKYLISVGFEIILLVKGEKALDNNA